MRGEDRPGLVYGITEVLAERGINITNLDAKTARVGEKLEYIQLFEVDIPKKLDYGRVQEKLQVAGKGNGGRSGSAAPRHIPGHEPNMMVS